MSNNSLQQDTLPIAKQNDGKEFDFSDKGLSETVQNPILKSADINQNSVSNEKTDIPELSLPETAISNNQTIPGSSKENQVDQRIIETTANIKIDDPPLEDETAADHNEPLEVKVIPELKHDRLIISEDLNFKRSKIKKLIDLCLEMLIKNFAKKQFQKLPEKYRNKILSQLPLDLPLKLCSEAIPEDGLDETGNFKGGSLFWKRLCLAVFPAHQTLLQSNKAHHPHYKQIFFELYCQTLLENFTPGYHEETELIQKLQLASGFVRHLKLRQLLPKGWTGSKGNDRIISALQYQSGNIEKGPLREWLNYSNKSDSGIDLGDEKETGQIEIVKDKHPVDHLNFATILKQCLGQLRELDICFTIQSVQMGFQWSRFGISTLDASNLSKALENSLLTHLTLKGSRVKDEHVVLLAKGLEKCRFLSYLNLSYNFIGDEGVVNGLSGILSDSGDIHLKHLDLSNNRLTGNCLQHLGSVLQRNTSLLTLKLNLNPGLGPNLLSFIQQLTSPLHPNVYLKTLELLGCNLDSQTVDAITKGIEQYWDWTARIMQMKDKGVWFDSVETHQNVENKLSKMNKSEPEMELTPASTAEKKRQGSVSSNASSHPKPKADKKGILSHESKPAKTLQKTVKLLSSKRRASLDQSKRASSGTLNTSNGQLQTTNSGSQLELRQSQQFLQKDDEKIAMEHERKKSITTFLSTLDPSHVLPLGWTHLNLSCNPLIKEEECGKQCIDAIKLNEYVLQFDIQETGMTSGILSQVKGFLRANREKAMNK